MFLLYCCVLYLRSRYAWFSTKVYGICFQLFSCSFYSWLTPHITDSDVNFLICQLFVLIPKCLTQHQTHIPIARSCHAHHSKRDSGMWTTCIRVTPSLGCSGSTSWAISTWKSSPNTPILRSRLKKNSTKHAPTVNSVPGKPKYNGDSYALRNSLMIPSSFDCDGAKVSLFYPFWLTRGRVYLST